MKEKMTNWMRRNIDMDIEGADIETMSFETDEKVDEAVKVERKNSRAMVLKWKPSLCLFGTKDGRQGKSCFVGSDKGSKAAYIVVAVGHRGHGKVSHNPCHKLSNRTATLRVLSVR